jgi:hypothetical protein
MSLNNKKIILKKKFTYLIDLVKYIKKNNKSSLMNLLDKFNDPSKKGYLYEKIWDVIIKCGCCSHCINSQFQHMDGNINLGKMTGIPSLEYYLKKYKIFSKNQGGASDITLQKNDGTWILISSKYFKDDIGHSIKDYEIQDILKEIQRYKHYYKKYEIWLFVNDKSKVTKIIQNSQRTNETISKNILKILDFSDLEKYYVLFQEEIQDINLNNKGELNNRFCNSMEKFQERFHQDLITSQTLKRISEGGKVLLWGWKCRAGKTFGCGGLLLKYNKKFGKCNCLIITPAPTETLSQFVDDMFNKYRDFNNFNIIEFKNGKELKLFKIESKNNNIIITSKQLLDDYVTDDTKIQSIIDLQLDLIIFDENHFGGCSQLSKDIITTYSTTNTVKLFLTATFQKPLLEWNIPQHCQFYWNIEDEQLCKKRNLKGLIEKHGVEVLDFINEDNKEDKLAIYDKMPNLQVLTTIMDSGRYNLIKKQIKNTKFGFSFEVLLSLTKKNKFNFQKEVANIMSYISGSFMGAVKDKKSMFERIKKISRNQDSRTTLCNENFTTQLWFLPFGQGMKINNVSKCLKETMLNDPILKEYEIMIINSHKEYQLKDLKGEISKKELEAKANGKLGLILLAGKQLSLGITLPLCDIVVLLNNTLSMDLILQMMYRCMSESSDGSKKCGFVVDLNISRVLNTLLEYNTNQKDKTIKEKFTYLIENNLINIDSDLFIGQEKKNNYGIKLVDKLLDIWKSDPINNHKRLLKKLEDLVIEIESNDQKELNTYFKLSGKSNNSIEIKLNDNNNQDLPSGKEKIILDKDDTTEDSSDDEEKSIKVSLTKDILSFVIPLSCILTIKDNKMDFLQMLENIKQNKELLDVFNTQSYIWWNRKDIINLITRLVKKYIKKNTEPYNIAIQFKMSLQSLIDEPEELLKLIDSCLKPKKIEKKKYGEVFTPMELVNEMLDKLDKYYKKINGKSIFEEKDFKWFDPANGMGNFPICVYYKLIEGLKIQIPNKEERKKHILENMLFMSELNKKNVFISKRIFDIENKYKLNLFCGDSLQLDTEKEWDVKEFDVILGNPPYQEHFINLKKGGPAKPLYHKFYNKFLPQSKFLIFITPSRWFSGGLGLVKFRKDMMNRNDLYSICHMDQNVSDKIFHNCIEIKGGLSYLIFNKNKKNNIVDFNNFKIKLNKYDIIIKPTYFSIIDKVIDYMDKYNPDLLSTKLVKPSNYKIKSNDERLVKNQKENYYKCYVNQRMGTINYINKKSVKDEPNFYVLTTEAYNAGNNFGCIYLDSNKVIFNQTYMGFKVSNIEEGKNLISYLDSYLIRFIVQCRKISQHISEKTLKWIPLLPLNKIYTDKDLFKLFNIEEHEKKLIKNIIKKSKITYNL